MYSRFPCHSPHPANDYMMFIEKRMIDFTIHISGMAANNSNRVAGNRARGYR